MSPLRCVLLVLPLLAACHRPWLDAAEPRAGEGPQAPPGNSWSIPAADSQPSAGSPTGAADYAPAGYAPAGHAPAGHAPAESWKMPTTQAAQAVAFAQSVAGAPYCWAGVGPHCYDCSGLTFAAWWWAGKRLPRSSDAQHEELSPVSMDALQAGDILWRPGHVGLYVGDGWAIHAPGSGKPVSYQRADRYVQARRP